MEFDLTTVAALLTVVGFSVNDTVIVSDRIRENMRKNRREPLASIINRSINETLSRTILTAGTAILVVSRCSSSAARSSTASRSRCWSGHRRHLLVDLRRQPDRAVSRLQAAGASQGGRVGGSRECRRPASADEAAGTTLDAREPDAARGVRARARRSGCVRCSPRLLVTRAGATRTRPLACSTPRSRKGLRSPMLFTRHGHAPPSASPRRCAAGSASPSTATTTSTASRRAPSCCSFLRALGAEPLLHIPHRLRDGYGLHAGALRSLRRTRARGWSSPPTAAAAAIARSRWPRARHRRDRLRPPPGPGTRPPALRRAEPDRGRRRLSVRGPLRAGVVFYLLLGTAHAAARARQGPFPTCAATSTWSRSARSPTSCRWSRRTASW